MTTTEKTCFKCNKTLPLEAFYKHKQMGDGHLNKCKECTKKDAFIHRENNLEKIRAYDRQRGNRQVYSYTKEYRSANKDKYKAHKSINYAVKSGVIKKLPCFACGIEKSEAHHPDYSAPLDVVWLCTACHKQTHAMAKRILAKEKSSEVLLRSEK